MQIIVVLLALGLIGAVFKWLGGAIYIIFYYVVLPIIGFSLLYIVIRSIYHAFNPEAKRAYLERKDEKLEENRKRKEQEEAEARAKEEREEAERRRIEFERQQHRDGDQQAAPYTYQIGTHGNESLAIRYGIANQEQKVKEYQYTAKGGEQKRNPKRDKVFFEPAGTIRLQSNISLTRRCTGPQFRCAQPRQRALTG
jgi:membrane protein implicated in regulation of membrane protease activity